MSDPRPDGLADGSSARELLRHPMVRRLLISELAATMSFGVLTAALGWQAYARTGDPLVLGLIGLFEFLPALILAIPAGQLADRVDRRYVTAAGNLGALVFTGLLLLDAAVWGLEAWPLYLLAAGLGGSRAFAGAGFNPMLAAAVTPRALPRTMALSSSTWQGALIVGPLLGGAFQALGDVPPYAAAMLLEATAGILVLTVTRRIGTDHKVVDAPPVTLRDATAGLRFIIATPALLAAISLDLVAGSSAGPRRCCPSWPRTSSTSARSAMACCARHPASARCSSASFCRSVRSNARWDRCCSPVWRYSGCSPSSSASPRTSS